MSLRRALPVTAPLSDIVGVMPRQTPVSSEGGEPPSSSTPLRYVALGDSLTEGKGDARPDGTHRGFADLLAGALVRHDGRARYVNLARPSVRIAEVLGQQVPDVRQHRPDLVTVIAGVNDVIAVRFDPRRVAEDLDGLFGALRAAAPGAQVVTATLPDLSSVSTVAAVLQHRVQRLSHLIRRAAGRSGVGVADLEVSVRLRAQDLALDKVHPGPTGHLALARAFGDLLGVDVPAPPVTAGPRATALRRARRTIVVAPQFMARRVARGALIAKQPPKQPQLRLPR